MKIQDKEVPTVFQRKICWAALTGIALAVVILLVCSLLFGLGALFVVLEPVLLPVVIAGFFAYILSPCVALVQKRVTKRIWAVTTVMAAAGARMPVLSNKPHEVTEPMVRHIFPTVPFDVVLGFTPAFPRKPNPASMHHIAEQWGVSLEGITLVGDSLFDARCAENAGTSLVLVGWGYAADPAALRAWPAPVCETVQELETLLLGS